MRSINSAILVVLSIFSISALAVSPVSWTAPVPDTLTETGGLAVLDGTSDTVVYEVGTELGTFSHGARISTANGILFVTWNSHSGFEGAAGTRILYSKSTDGGQTWSPAAVIIDSIGVMADPPATGTSINSRHVESLNGRMYMLASVYQITGWDGSTAQSTMQGLIATMLDAQGDPTGPIFWLKDTAPAGYTSIADWTTLDSNTYPYAVNDTKTINGDLSAIYHYQRTYEVTADDGVSLIEPTFYTCPDGVQIGLFRTSNEPLALYAASRSDYNAVWSQATQSTIPDSHSMNVATVLPDGSTVLIGNNVSQLYYRSLLVISRTIDGVNFDSAWALRYDPPAMEYSLPGDNKGLGFQYPDTLIFGDDIWVSYSINKESVGVTKIPLDRIMRPVADMTSDDAVNLYDFIEVANSLGDCGDPADPNCVQF